MTKHRILVMAVCFILIGVWHIAHADEESLWLTTGEWSRHDHDVNCPHSLDPAGSGREVPCRERYRQNNTGIGVQYNMDRDTSIVAGWYNNSVHAETVYGGMTYTPLHMGEAKFGVVGIMATGYTKYMPAVPVASFYGTYEHNRVGVNLMWLPNVVIAVQFKVRVW